MKLLTEVTDVFHLGFVVSEKLLEFLACLCFVLYLYLTESRGDKIKKV